MRRNYWETELLLLTSDRSRRVVKKNPHIGKFVTAISLCTLLGSCGGGSDRIAGPPPPPPVATVSVVLPSANLTIGQTIQAAATTKDAAGNVLAGRTVSWSSTNTAVGAVNTSGVVTAVSEGSTSITAASEGQTGSASLTVSPIPVASVSVTLAAPSLTVGGTSQATATTKDASGNVLTGRVVAWASSNAAVTTVSASGLVTAVGAGNANVTATSEGQSGSATLTVTQVPVASVSVTLAASSLTVGAATQATVTTKDANGNVLAGRSVSWTSSNTAVATVNASGVVTAVGAGTASIAATSEGQSGSSTITAATPIGGIVSNNTTLTLANSPYWLTQNLQIADGATLTIQPGVQIFGATKNNRSLGSTVSSRNCNGEY